MKSYTDLEQSKKLAEILPRVSADMRFCFSHTLGGRIRGHYPMIGREPSMGTIPCWSLAALLEQLDDEITDEEGSDYTLTIVKENLQYQLYYHDALGQAEDIETDYYDYMVDACYEIIIKLHELNLL